MTKNIKMVMITYNMATDIEVMEVLEHCAVKSYTKVTGAFGKGEMSGTHLGNDVWPGMNNILYAACDSEAAGRIVERIKELRKEIGREGVKAFILPVDEIT